MSAAERKLRGLKNRKRSIMTSFAGIKNFVSGYQPDRDKCEVPVRLENLSALWDEFNSVETELETMEEDNEVLEAYQKERMEFERIYYRAKGTLLLWNQPSLAAQQASTQSVDSTNNYHVKLPDVKLPVFSGDFKGWLNFHDLYVSLVHSSTSLSTIQKFYYLRSSLAGEALQLIQTIPISSEQYAVAWNLLESHYQNSRRLKRSYVQSLFNFPVMKRETAAELHSLTDNFQTNVKVLKQLGEQTEHWDTLLIHLLSTRLDSTTRRSWEEYAETNNSTKFQQLVDFLQHRVNVLENVASGSTDVLCNVKKPNPPRMTSYSAAPQNRYQCPACSSEHFLFQCDTFFAMTIEEKEELIQRLKLCRNCLRRGHIAHNCLSTSSCRKCHDRHHTQLCGVRGDEGSSHPASINHHGTNYDHDQTNSETRLHTPAAYTGTMSFTSHGNTRSKILLGTAAIILVDDNGEEHHVRALLDSGSECSFVTEQLANRMKVSRNNVHLPIAGIGQASTEVQCKIRSLIKSRISTFSKEVELFILPKVTVDLPSIPIDVSKWPFPTGIHLADPGFYQPAPIDVVLGAELFFELFNVDGRIPLGDSLPTFVNSALGWIVSGKISVDEEPLSVTSNLAVICKTTLFKTSKRYPYYKTRTFRRSRVISNQDVSAIYNFVQK